MSCPQCGCSVVEVTNIPGLTGAAGAAGANGVNAFTVTTQNLNLPSANTSITVYVGNTSWMIVGQIVVIGDGTNFGTFQVVSITSSTAAFLKWVNAPGDSSSGSAILAAATVSPGGAAGKLAGSLPGSMTDNTGGTVSSTLAASVGKRTVAFYVNLADLANHDVITALTLGYAFRILSVAFVVEKAATTAAKLATVNPSISGTAVTGGVLSLTSANCTPQGVVIPASGITAANTGAATDTISITASAVTTFIEGGGWIVLLIQNTDEQNAFASLSSKINALITAI